MSSKLKVLVIDDQPKRYEAIAQAIEAAGDQVVARVEDPRADLQEIVRTARPDVVIIDIESPGRDMLEDMRRISHEQHRPIVMFVDEADPDSIRRAIRAGVAAYVVKGAAPERVRPVLDVAIARFREEAALRDQLAEALSTLEERKLIDRAKAILMQRRSIAEPEAYQLLRKTAMDRSMRLVEVARRLVEAADLI
jgi:two-component system, response regulator / RNA-binding antiterminator